MHFICPDCNYALSVHCVSPAQKYLHIDSVADNVCDSDFLYAERTFDRAVRSALQKCIHKRQQYKQSVTYND